MRSDVAPGDDDPVRAGRPPAAVLDEYEVDGLALDRHGQAARTRRVDGGLERPRRRAAFEHRYIVIAVE